MTSLATAGIPVGPGMPVLEMRAVSKSFGHVQALKRVDFAAMPGEVHGIVGDNGAGKSTMLKIMSGLYQSDTGAMFIGGSQVSLHSPADALQRGIAVVYQDLALVEVLDVATNMALGSLPRRRGMLDRKRMVREAQQVFDALKIRVGSVDTPVGLLSGGERQIVAIARAIRKNARIILLDEPTAALGVRETAHVGEIVGEVRNQGKAIICISHDLEFVFKHADRITVMRLGNSVAVREVARTTKDEIVGLITGTIGPDDEMGMEGDEIL